MRGRAELRFVSGRSCIRIMSASDERNTEHPMPLEKLQLSDLNLNCGTCNRIEGGLVNVLVISLSTQSSWRRCCRRMPVAAATPQLHSRRLRTTFDHLK